MSANSEVTQSLFVKTLAQVIQSNDFTGAYRNLSTQEKVEKAFILSPEEKEKLAECGLIPEKLREQISLFFQAVAFAVEQKCGIMASSIVELNGEGFGRGMVYCGRLIALNKSIRGSQQFIFQNLEKLSKEGEAYIDEALSWVQKYQEIANL